MTQKINPSADLQAIYRQWGEGPSAEEYYEAARRYFEAKERKPEREIEEFHSRGKTRN